uniref:Uncharacterized protein n=1 Tax=Rhizophora mucronata TaxID=61149 RepID=A0A2P2N7K2_RHIMU
MQMQAISFQLSKSCIYHNPVQSPICLTTKTYVVNLFLYWYHGTKLAVQTFDPNNT